MSVYIEGVCVSEEVDVYSFSKVATKYKQLQPLNELCQLWKRFHN